MEIAPWFEKLSAKASYIVESRSEKSEGIPNKTGALVD